MAAPHLPIGDRLPEVIRSEFGPLSRHQLQWKIGFEIETLAPRGCSRRDLADRIARNRRGSIRSFFHPQSEPSQVPGQPIFENLTHGFAAHDENGVWIASFVDDLTLRAGLDREAEPRSGWYRIVADDARLLQLVTLHCDPNAPAEHVLDPLAALFGTAAEPREGRMIRVADRRNVAVALCALLPGERERPCEIVTAPIEKGHEDAVSELLRAAREMGFSVPREGAIHLHFDGARLCSAVVIARLVRLLSMHREALRTLVGVNPNCIRLGSWPDELMERIADPSFASMTWDEARQCLGEVKLTKYCDFNLLNLVTGNAAKHTFEVRILPVSLQPEPIMAAARLFEALLLLCLDESFDLPDSFESLLRRLDLPPQLLTVLAGIRGSPGTRQPSESLLPGLGAPNPE